MTTPQPQPGNPSVDTADKTPQTPQQGDAQGNNEAPITPEAIEQMKREGDQDMVSQQQLDQAHQNPAPPLPTGSHNSASDQPKTPDQQADIDPGDLVSPGD